MDHSRLISSHHNVPLPPGKDGNILEDLHDLQIVY